MTESELLRLHASHRRLDEEERSSFVFSPLRGFVRRAMYSRRCDGKNSKQDAKRRPLG